MISVSDCMLANTGKCRILVKGTILLMKLKITGLIKQNKMIFKNDLSLNKVFLACNENDKITRT